MVLSDYAKGMLTERVIRAVIEAARRLGKPVIVDPKGHDYRVYRGATLITPNAKELAAAVHRPVRTEAEISAAAAQLAHMVDSEAVLVTRSEEGMSLHVEGQAPVHIPAYPVKVRDVSGAGDTVAAVMAVLLAMKAPYEFAMRAANAAAAVVVGKRGTSTVSLGELRHRILPAASLAPEDKIVFDWIGARRAIGRMAPARSADWLHQWLLRSSAPRVTSNCWPKRGPLATAWSSVSTATPRPRGLKGKGRPINPAEGRAEVLAALEAVDLVVVFDEDTPLELIKRVRPAVLVKGADYKIEEVVGRDVVEGAGGDVLLVSLVPGQSTTGLVRRSAEFAAPAARSTKPTGS